MGNKPGRIGTIGVDRPGNQICDILINIQSLSQKKKKIQSSSQKNKKDTPRIIRPL